MKITKEIQLDRKGVDQLTELVDEWLRNSHEHSKTLIRTRLAIETMILDIHEHYEGKKTVSVSITDRMGVRTLKLSYEDSPYNPLSSESEDEWTSTMLSMVSITPVWKYRAGHNVIVIHMPLKVRDELMLIGSALAAIAFGLLGSVLPQPVTRVIMEYFLQPVETVFMNLLSTFAGLLVFLALITGTCGIGNVSELSKIGKYMIGRFLGCTFVGSSLFAIVMIPFFSFNWGSNKTESQVKQIFSMIIDIIPSNPVSPFQNGNMLQIVFMGLLVGAVLLLLGTKVSKIQTNLLQANLIFMKIVDGVCKLLPLYIFASLTLLFWNNGIGVFRTIWKPIVFSFILSNLLLVGKVILCSIKFKVSPAVIFRKILPTYMIGLTTASSVAAMGASLETNEKKMGIAPELSNFAYPIGILLYCSTCSGCFISIVYYLTELNGNSVDIGWFITVWLFVTIISFALPPVSGGTLVGLGIIFAQFNISNSCLGVAGTVALLLDFVMTSTRVGMMHIEMAYEAEHFRLLDKEVLRRP